jgi:hypothetical protein
MEPSFSNQKKGLCGNDTLEISQSGSTTKRATRGGERGGVSTSRRGTWAQFAELLFSAVSGEIRIFKAAFGNDYKYCRANAFEQIDSKLRSRRSR